MKRDNLVRARWALGIAIALGLISMMLYPGGTGLTTSTVRYSLQQNFLSDLGMTVAYNGQPNLRGAVCFVAALLLLLGGAVGVLIELVKMCSVSPRGRKLARAAVVTALCACFAFVGVAFTPENRLMAAHIDFTFWGFRIAPVATLMLILAAVNNPAVPGHVTRLLALLTAAFAAYAAILEWGPDPSSAYGLHFQVVAQKAIACVAVSMFLALSGAIRRGAANAAHSAAM